MGKYSKRLNERPLPKNRIAEDDEDPKFQEKVNAVKADLVEKYGVRSAIDYVEMYVPAREVRDAAKKAVKDANLQLTAITQLLAEAYEREGLKSLTLDNGYSVANEEEIIAAVKDKGAFLNWCVKNDLLSEMSLPWQTRNRICKEAFLAGEEDPDGIELRLRDKFVLRRVR